MNITSIKLTNRQLWRFTKYNYYNISLILKSCFINAIGEIFKKLQEGRVVMGRKCFIFGTSLPLTTMFFFIRAFCLSSHRRWVTWNNKLKPFLIEEKNRITAYLGSIEFCSSLRIVLIDSMWYIPMNTSMWYIPMDTFNVIYIPMNTSSVLHVCPFG